jgi:hypothetical protein
VEQPQDSTQTIRGILLLAGALLGAYGMSKNNDVIVYIALGILAAGAVLALIRRAKMRRTES